MANQAPPPIRAGMVMGEDGTWKPLAGTGTVVTSGGDVTTSATPQPIGLMAQNPQGQWVPFTPIATTPPQIDPARVAYVDTPNTFTQTQTMPGLVLNGVAMGITVHLANGTDMNTVVRSGTYWISAPLNSPAMNYDFYFTVVESGAAGYLTQLAWSFNLGTGIPATFVRQEINAIWTAWYEFSMAVAAVAAKP